MNNEYFGDDHLILIVEDSRSISSELERKIQKIAGMDTRVCTSFAEAAAFLEADGENLFLAILDLHLPDAPDGEVVDLFCSRNIPCIVFTADMEESTRKEMFAKDIIDYVVKDSNAVANIIEYISRLRENRKAKVLVVEDSRSFRTLLVDMLERHMYQVEWVEDAESGLEKLKEDKEFTLVVIDYGLPGMDGVTLTRRIRSIYSKERLGIIGISVSDDPFLTIRYIKSGADDYIAKPFQMEEFISRVAHNVETVVNQRNLREAKAVMNRFLGMASHDLRSPINSVKGFTDLLLEGVYGEMPPDQVEALEYIRAANDHMRDLVIDLLDMSVIEAGELRLFKTKGNLCDLIDLRLRIHALGAKKKNITVTADCACIGDFTFDVRRIGQVMDNLLTNALKFTPHGGSVTVSLDVVDNMAQVCVRDSGQGVPPGEEGLLFQSFGKTSVRPTGGESSTGLGLPIVKTIVEKHDGRVWVESEYGYGAAFYFTLPLDSGE